MEIIIGLLVIIAVLGLLNLAAARWGVTTRDGKDWTPRIDA